MLKPSWRKYHQEVDVLLPDGSPLSVDKGIAEVLQAMWSAGIKTLNSCEAHVDDLCYVVLADVADLQRLNHLVSLGTLAVNIMNDDVGAPDSSPEESWRWRYRLRPVHPNGVGEWRYIVSVEFPSEHVPEIIRCLTEYREL